MAVLRSSLKVFRPGTGLLAGLLLAAGPIAAAPPSGPAAVRGPGGCPGPVAVRARLVMGTVLEVRLPASTPGSDALADAVFDDVSRLEQAVSTWRDDAELPRLEAAGGGEARVSAELAETLEVALSLRDQTGGALDPAVGALVAAYDLHGAGRWPTDAEVLAARSLSGRTAVALDPLRRVVRFSSPGVRLDLDAVAKGVALDRAGRILRAHGVGQALLNFGGQVLAVGPPPGCPPFRVAVASPDREGAELLAVDLRDASVATSSNAERERVVDGKPAGHLLDPRTGGFVPFRGSVSVLAASAARADGLATAWFVLGPDRFRATSPSAPERAEAALAFLVPSEDGWGVVADAPFQRLRPPPPGRAGGYPM